MAVNITRTTTVLTVAPFPTVYTVPNCFHHSRLCAPSQTVSTVRDSVRKIYTNSGKTLRKLGGADVLSRVPDYKCVVALTMQYFEVVAVIRLHAATTGQLQSITKFGENIRCAVALDNILCSCSHASPYCNYSTGQDNIIKIVSSCSHYYVVAVTGVQLQSLVYAATRFQKCNSLPD